MLLKKLQENGIMASLMANNDKMPEKLVPANEVHNNVIEGQPSMEPPKSEPPKSEPPKEPVYSEEDISMVMVGSSHVCSTKEQAIAALKKCNGNVIDAVMSVLG
jgi:NACalpha-BTF3-like transcription factor